MMKPMAAGWALMSMSSPLSAAVTTVRSMLKPKRRGTLSPTSELLGIVVSPNPNEGDTGVSARSAEME